MEMERKWYKRGRSYLSRQMVSMPVCLDSAVCSILDLSFAPDYFLCECPQECGHMRVTTSHISASP